MSCELNACPFCGSQAKIFRCDKEMDGKLHERYKAACKHCGARMDSSHSSPEGAAAAWNFRAKAPSEDPRPLTLEELLELNNTPVWVRTQPDHYRCGVVGVHPGVTTPDMHAVIGFPYGWEWAEEVAKWGTIYDRKPSE